MKSECASLRRHTRADVVVMPAPVFTRNDFENLELVRQIVLHRLKDDPDFNLFYQEWDAGTEQYVTYDEPRPRVRSRFQMLADEVLWQLFIQGVITPGKNPATPDLPWFRLTSYGEKVLETERFLPHDPTGYLDDVGVVTETEVGQAGLPYLEEALRCFQSGCHLASVLLLGVAAEAVFLQLCSVVLDALRDDAEREAFSQLQSVRPKHRWVVEKYNSMPRETRRSELPESLDMTLTSLYDLIRRQRNELGHPQEEPPTIEREQAFMNLKLFPTFIKDVEALAAYCRSHDI